MHQFIRKNWEKSKNLVLFLITITILLLLAVVYKSDEKITKKSELIVESIKESDLIVNTTPIGMKKEKSDSSYNDLIPILM